MRRSFHRSLIAARCGADSRLEIWGLVHSGPRWLQAMRGGRDVLQIIPPVLMVAVTGPGRLLVSLGTRATLGELSSGAARQCEGQQIAHVHRGTGPHNTALCQLVRAVVAHARGWHVFGMPPRTNARK